MGKKIVVFGSYITDFVMRTTAFPVPGQSVIGSSFKMGPGGKGSNQTIAALKTGANAIFVTKVANDTFGEYAQTFYKTEGYDTSGFIIGNASHTGAANIVVNEQTGENAIVVTPGISMEYTPEDMAHVKAFIDDADYLVLQLEVSEYATSEAIIYARQKRIPIILNPAPAADFVKPLLKDIDYLTPNETEASLLTGLPVDEDKSNIRAAAKALYEMGVAHVIITLGGNGVYAFDGKNGQFIPALDVVAVDTTGAGDAFNGGFAAALAEGKGFFDAALYGVAVSGLSVTKEGTSLSMPTKQAADQVYKTLK